jgi:hypothetical protein
MSNRSVTDLDPNMRLRSIGDVAYRWFDPIATDSIRISGFNWIENDSRYRRLPVDIGKSLPPAVDSLADCCAGGQLSFRTNSSRLAVHAKFASPHGADHMPATCTLGFDCYDGPCGAMKYLATSRFSIAENEYTVPFFETAEPVERLITINMPLYNSRLEFLEIGLEPGSLLAPPPIRSIPGKLVVYGTSITQGGCASRPGMCYTNQMSRKLDVEFLNLGFSGSGKGERAVVETIASVEDMAMLMIDYEANIGDGLCENLPEFISIVRARHPDLSIVVLSKVMYGSFNLRPDGLRQLEKLRCFQKDLVAELSSAGDENIYFIDGSTLLGDDYGDCAVDGCHPTDLGFHRMAEGLLPQVSEILGSRAGVLR